MGFNLGNMLVGALPGLLSGNPLLAIGGGVSAGTGGSSLTTTVGNLDNSGLSGLFSSSLQDNYNLLATQLAFQSQINWQAEAFNEMAEEKSETLREGNVLRDIALKQREADNKITEEFVRMIKD